MFDGCKIASSSLIKYMYTNHKTFYFLGLAKSLSSLNHDFELKYRDRFNKQCNKHITQTPGLRLQTYTKPSFFCDYSYRIPQF